MATTHGMDPREVRALGHDLKAKAEEIRRKAQWLDRVVHNAYWTGPEAARYKYQWWPAHRAKMWSVAEGLEGFGQSALNNATEQDRASGVSGRTAGGASSISAAGVIPGAAALLQAETPSEVARAWARLSEEEQQQLIETYPQVIGNLDGIPPWRRYEANRLNIAAYVEELRATREELVTGLDRPSVFAAGGVFDQMNDLQRASLLGNLDASIEKFEGLLSGTQVLVFDPQEGTIAEVFGDIQTADDVAIVVPGIGNDFAGYDATNAQNLHGGNPELATIQWLGYDTPAGFGLGMMGDPSAFNSVRASDWAPELSGFTDGLRATVGGEISVVAHSYGTRLATEAAKVGMSVDRVILLGSPGVDAQNASVFAGADVYAMANDGDAITHADLLPSGGTDPTTPGFGATVLPGNPEGMVATALDVAAAGVPFVPGTAIDILTGIPAHSTYLDPGQPSFTQVTNTITGMRVTAEGLDVHHTVHDDGSATTTEMGRF